MNPRTAAFALAARLRFPWLFALTAGLFLLDVLVPDPLPFFDELLLGLLTLLFSAWKKRRRNDAGEA